MTSVKGGTLETAVTMRAKLNKEGVMDIDTYQAWARTITDAPALINSEVGMIDLQSEVHMMTMFLAMLAARKRQSICRLVSPPL